MKAVTTMNAIDQLFAVSATPDAYFRHSEVISWPEPVRQYYERYDILSQQTCWETVCDQCDEEHAVEIETDTSPDGKSRFFYFCPTAGITTINPAHMKTWRVDFGRLAGSIAESLELGGDYSEIVPDRAWKLGEIKGDVIHTIFLVRGSSWGDGIDLLRRFPASYADVIITFPSSLEFYPITDPPPRLLSIERLFSQNGDVYFFDDAPLKSAVAESDKIILKTVRKSDGRRFPTPTGAKWSDVHITFIDGETLSISVKGLIKKYTCYEIDGLHDGRSKKSVNQQWVFLYGLAEFNGVHGKHQGFNRNHQKTKENLDHALRDFFGIDEISIEWNDTDKQYVTEFNLRKRTRGG